MAETFVRGDSVGDLLSAVLIEKMEMMIQYYYYNTIRQQYWWEWSLYSPSGVENFT
jgi:hypothetical protein